MEERCIENEKQPDMKDMQAAYGDVIVDIRGLNKADVLAALYNNSFLVIHTEEYSLEDMTRGEAEEILSKNTWVDYIKNRPIKVHFDKDDYIITNLYDRTNGQGAGKRAIEELRRSLSK